MKTKALVLTIILLVLLFASFLDAKKTTFWQKLSYKVVSVGKFSLNIGPKIVDSLIPTRWRWRLLLWAGEKVLDYFLDSDNGSSGYATSYSPPAKPPQVIKVDIKAPIPYDVLKYRLNSLLNSKVIKLENGGSLNVEQDGKMVFSGMPVKGYIYLHYDRTMSIWNSDGMIRMLVFFKEGKIHFARKPDDVCTDIFQWIFGVKQ
jgi:hypothetical protein